MRCAVIFKCHQEQAERSVPNWCVITTYAMKQCKLSSCTGTGKIKEPTQFIAHDSIVNFVTSVLPLVAKANYYVNFYELRSN